MCGINGIFAYNYAANPIDRAELTRTRDHMTARGPDDKGAWISADEHIGFGHRRLSVSDLSEAGAQPMANADGTLIVTFDGRIYNYQALRHGLEAKGYVFRSQSDTEVLLHLYADKGAAMVQELRGMFALAIWDLRRGALFLARDPYGIKPLYYADDGWTFRFASQVKALLAGGGVSRDPEPAGLVGFYLWGSVPEPFTTYQAIQALPAGCTLLVDRVGAGEPQRYHSIAKVYCDAEQTDRVLPSGAEAQTALTGALLDSVRHHLMADVPVGAFLSAGIDSGALVGLMQDAGQQDIQTVTLAFEAFDGRHDDAAPLAEQVARHYGTRHTTRIVGSAEFEADLPKLLEAMDQPSIDGIKSWFVSKSASELGLKVALSGLGGDELFGGTSAFTDIPKEVRRLSVPALIPGIGRLARMGSQPLVRRLGLNPKTVSLLEFGGSYSGAYLLHRGLFLPWELQEILDGDLIREGLRRLQPMKRVKDALRPLPRGSHARVAALESSLSMRNQRLRDLDWASMAHSLEVRIPLADSALLLAAAPLTRAGLAVQGKTMLANAPARALPRAIIDRKKTGSATPLEGWMRSHLAEPGSSEHTILQHQRWRPWTRDWAVAVGRPAALSAAQISRRPVVA